ncbi:cyanophycin synthetase [[Phormidium ambiguum] IAM M-71]|uniref:Cyanophycin synthetase n=1 Tax=[Phormidium ambiguum] IAM M-71 TaxID=454136 RepID=A0A1U7IES5_9CYAN|nr:cyanophycin synthetase [Phormidium ambiguum]OKH35406.1 cyanophycin synthetase [Phormidium ambiguum IAM M-71]
MKIIKLQTLRGPNYWSIHRHKLIEMWLDLEEMNEVYSNEVPEFYEGLVEILPSLEEHFCSPGHRGGFLKRVKQGTLMGHVIEHVALELQTLAGMRVKFGRARSTSQTGIYRVIFEYRHEVAGRYAAKAALRLVENIIDRGYYPHKELKLDLEDLRKLKAETSLGLTTESILKEAEARKIPWTELPARGIVQLGYGIHQRRIVAAQTCNTSLLGTELACDKEGTITMLREANLPVPKGTVIYRFRQLENAIAEIGFPIVIKPLDGNHGRGITLNINSWRDAEDAYDLAKSESKSGGVLVERYYRGRDFRVLVVNGKVVAVAERVPAHVIGDGKSTIAELVAKVNQDPRRGDGHENVLTRITIDEHSEQLLAQQKLTVNSIPEKGEICYLKATANLSTGGTASDRTTEIHPQNIWIAQRAARIIGLDIAGIDITSPEISRPLTEVDGVIVEVNAAPGLRMHLQPSEGTPRNVAAPILDMLYPPDRPQQIPIIAVTGTNGKTTTTRLIAHIFRQTKKTVGYTTTDGTYIGEFLAEPGDNTGPQSAQLILQDPSVEIAVLETARGGILRSGLAFSHCDVGVVLNVSEDHLGLHNINTLEDMAHVKSVIAEATNPDGFVVLNADDPLVAAMAKSDRVKAQVTYFSMDRWNPIIWEHIQNGGVAAVYDDGYIIFLSGEDVIQVEQAVNIPLTLGGKAPFMIANALAASLAAYVQGVSLENISTALRTFRASVEQTPGRMNLINRDNFHVLLDYAHNPAGYQALGQFVENWSTGKRIGVIGAPGDRRDQDLHKLGVLAAQIFDQVIIKEDADNRGRKYGEVAALIAEGISQTNPDFPYEIILNEQIAIETALIKATEHSLVVILPDKVDRALDLLKQPILVNQ